MLLLKIRRERQLFTGEGNFHFTFGMERRLK